MRIFIRSILALAFIGALTAGSTTSASADISDDDARKIFAILYPDLHPSAATLALLKKKVRALQTATAESAPAGNASAVNKRPKLIDSTVTPPPAAVSTNNVSACPGVHFLLRDSWSDLGALGCPSPVAKATGASISYTDDYVAANRNWAAKGMAGIAYSEVDKFYPGVTAGGWFDKSFALYVEDNSSYNSNAKLTSKNSDTRTAGFSGELGYSSANGDEQFFRVTPNFVRDAIKGTDAVAVMGEYIPSLYSWGLWHVYHWFDDAVNFQLDPDIKVQYASTTDPKNPLQFSGKSQSLRIGPDLTVDVKPFAAGTNNLLGRIGLNSTFHPWYEAYNGHGSYWWTSAVFYNFTDDGNFALKFSYNRGLDENSGTMTNQYIVSLAGKY